MNIDWLTFLLKLLLVPTFIGLVSLAGRRWGTTVSGWLIGLPLSSGPVAFILALEQGMEFASKASQGIMLGIVSVYAFCVAYSWVAIRRGWLESTLTGAVAFFVATFTLNMISLSFWVETTIAVLALVASLYLLPRVGSDRMGPELTRWELPLRMASATVLVFLITGLATLLGPQLTGLLTPFPIYVTTMGVFTHRSQGGEETVKLIRGVIIGTFTFIIFFLILSSSLVSLGLGFSFLAAIAASLLIHLSSLQLLKPNKRFFRLLRVAHSPDRQAFYDKGV
jgi:hypothetical protein